MSGTCPAAGEGTPPARSDYIEAPSYLGYAYLAEQLASRGFLVVSINANRGITAGPIQSNVDRGLNLGRGRLVLKHLEFLSRWNQGLDPTPDSLGFSLRNRIDFNKVVLVGHSRGGEGVRAAYNLYTGRNADFPPYSAVNWRALIPDTVNVQGIFEIAPVDRQTGRTFIAEGVTWNTMVGSCDGDVINQQGIWPYDRMMKSFTEQPAKQKSFYYVIGANHNYWNTQWQFSDSSGCFNPAEQIFVTDPATGVLPGVTGSAAQRTTGSASVLALVRGVLRASEEGDDDEGSQFLRNFDPQYTLPTVVTDVTRIQRGFIASPSSQVTRALEDFDQPTGTSQFGIPNDTSNVTVEHVPVSEHGAPFSARDPMGNLVLLPPFVRAAKVTWQNAGSDVFFQINFAAAGGGISLSQDHTLDFRVDRESPLRTSFNPSGATNFHVQLVAADGSLSDPVAAGDFIEVVGPFGTPDADLTGPPTFFPLIDGYHLNLPTARIPIGNFHFRNLNQTRGIRLTFDDTSSGQIYVTDFRASRQGVRSLGEEGDNGASQSAGSISNASINASTPRVIDQGNVIEDIRYVDEGNGPGNGTVRFTVRTETPVPVTNELLTMGIGPVPCDGWYVGGSTQRMAFDCPADAISSLRGGEPISFGNNARHPWKVGAFSNDMLE